MKVIDLLNKIANGEEVPKRIRIDHWCYEFEWVEHDENYYDKHHEIDLMSCLSMSEEELNYEVRELKEDKKIERLQWCNIKGDSTKAQLLELRENIILQFDKINEIIDYLKEISNE